MGNAKKVSDAASSSDRRDIRGRSALPPLELTLSASDGKKRETEARWPPLGANTIKGRLVSQVTVSKLIHSKKCHVMR